MKKIKALIFLVFSIYIGICADVYADISSENVVFNTEYTVKQNFSVNEKPKYKIKYNHDSADVYRIRLSANDNADIITLPSTHGNTITKIFEFPVFEDGIYSLKAEILKNGECIGSEEFSLCYIEPISPGYKNRGFNTHFSHFNHDERDTLLLQALGANTYRDAFYWGTADKGGFEYDFSVYDSSFESIINTDMELVCCLIATHWYTPELEFDKDENLKLLKDEDIEKYAEFALETAKHYPQIKRFEICNEPGFLYTGEEYLKIALATSKKLKEYDPDLEIYVGCMIDNDDGAEERLKFAKDFFKKELYPYVDAISFHIYTTNKYADTSIFYKQVTDYESEINTEGGWKEIAMTESGWPVNTDWANVTYEKQASELVKRMIISDSMNLSLVTMYELKNSDTEDGSNVENNYGIITKDYFLKPSYFSVKHYFEKTNKAQYIGKAYLCDGIEAYAYVSNDDCFLIAWAENSNRDQNITVDSHKKTQYTFPENVVVTDMFGKKLGNILSPDHEPKYIHGLSSEFILNSVRDYGVNYLSEILSDRLDNNESISEKYLKMCDSGDISEVEDYINYCYDLGISLINTHDMDITILSETLSALDKAAELGVRVASLCDNTPKGEISKEIKSQYKVLSDIIKFSEYDSTAYFCEPYRKGMDVLKFVDKYQASNMIIPVNGKFYSLDKKGKLTVKGKASDDFIAIKLVNGDKLIYWDTIAADSAGDFSVDINLPEHGQYLLKINNGEEYSEIIDYTYNGYISVEDKITYAENIRAERLFRTSVLLLQDFLEDKKYVLPENMYSIRQNGREYIEFEYKRNNIIAALYDSEQMRDVVINDTDGIVRLDVTDLTDYEIRIFIWEDISSMMPAYNACIFKMIFKKSTSVFK